MVLSFLLAIENDYLKYVRSMRLHIQEWKWTFAILMLYIEVTEIIKENVTFVHLIVSREQWKISC